jgi:hypothetical protein
LIDADPITVTVAVPLVAPGVLAVMVVVPPATPVTGTVAVVALAANVALAGAVATLAFAEFTLTVSPPAGAGEDNVNVRFWVAFAFMVSVDGEKLRVTPLATPQITSTCALGYPYDVAMMVDVPLATPVTVMPRDAFGTVAPWGTKTLVGLMAILEGSLVASEMNTPPEPAGVASVTANCAFCPGATIRPLCKRIGEAGADTVTLAVAVP